MASKLQDIQVHFKKLQLLRLQPFRGKCSVYVALLWTMSKTAAYLKAPAN